MSAMTARLIADAHRIRQATGCWPDVIYKGPKGYQFSEDELRELREAGMWVEIFRPSESP